MTADRRKRAASPVVLAAAVTALCMVGDSMLYVVLPVHWEEFGLTAFWQAGLLLSVNRFVRLPLNPLVSRLYRRLSARSGMLGAAALACATTAGYGLAGTFWALLLLRALWGLAWTFLRLGAYFTVMETAEASQRGRAMGLYNGLMRTGSLCGMLLGGFLADSLGTAWTCAIFAAVSLAAFPLILAAVPASARGMAADAAEEDDFSLAAHWRVLAVLAVGTAVAFVYQGMLVSTVSYLVQVRFPEGLALGGALLGAASLGGVLQAVRWMWEPWLAPFCGWLSDRPGVLRGAARRVAARTVAGAGPRGGGGGHVSHHGGRRGGGGHGGPLRAGEGDDALLHAHRCGRGGGTGGFSAERPGYAVGVVPARGGPPPRGGGAVPRRGAPAYGVFALTRGQIFFIRKIKRTSRDGREGAACRSVLFSLSPAAQEI